MMRGCVSALHRAKFSQENSTSSLRGSGSYTLVDSCACEQALIRHGTSEKRDGELSELARKKRACTDAIGSLRSQIIRYTK